MKEFFRKVGKKITPAYITKVAILSAVSFILYMFAKFSLPFMFPSFLDMQFSELPAILAGFSLGPVAGALVIIIKCLIKFPFSGTAFVGEVTDIVLGILYVVPASLIYHRNKNKKNAVIGMAVGTAVATVGAILVNRFVSVPFYVQFYFKGNFGVIVNMCSVLYPSMTESTFYWFYLFLAVLPFNILRLSLVSIVTFFVYKSLSKALHWEIKPRKKVAAESAGSDVPEEAQDVSKAEAVKDTNEKESDQP